MERRESDWEGQGGPFESGSLGKAILWEAQAWMTSQSARKRTGIRLFQAEGPGRARAWLAESKSEWGWRTASKGQECGCDRSQGGEFGQDQPPERVWVSFEWPWKATRDFKAGSFDILNMTRQDVEMNGLGADGKVEWAGGQ